MDALKWNENKDLLANYSLPQQNWKVQPIKKQWWISSCFLLNREKSSLTYIVLPPNIVKLQFLLLVSVGGSKAKSLCIVSNFQPYNQNFGTKLETSLYLLANACRLGRGIIKGVNVRSSLKMLHFAAMTKSVTSPRKIRGWYHRHSNCVWSKISHIINRKGR